MASSFIPRVEVAALPARYAANHRKRSVTAASSTRQKPFLREAKLSIPVTTSIRTATSAAGIGAAATASLPPQTFSFPVVGVSLLGLFLLLHFFLRKIPRKNRLQTWEHEGMESGYLLAKNTNKQRFVALTIHGEQDAKDISTASSSTSPSIEEKTYSNLAGAPFSEADFESNIKLNRIPRFN